MKNNLMLFPENAHREFDFNTMVGDKSYHTICGLPVKVDKIIKDITKTTVVAISGTMIIKGVKIRGVWDCYGNIVECQKSLQLLSPKGFFANINSIFENTTESMFRLVSMEAIEEGGGI